MFFENFVIRTFCNGRSDVVDPAEGRTFVYESGFLRSFCSLLGKQQNAELTKSSSVGTLEIY